MDETGPNSKKAHAGNLTLFRNHRSNVLRRSSASPHPAEYQGNRQRSILAAICSSALKQVREWIDLHPSELQGDWELPVRARLSSRRRRWSKAGRPVEDKQYSKRLMRLAGEAP